MVLMRPRVLRLFHLYPRVMRAIGSGLHMLFLAGLMGLITVGAAAFIDIGLEEEESATDEDAPAGDVISGTPRDDLIIGSGGSDQIAGYGGDDLVEARNGDDTVFGDSGDDTLRGGAGTMTCMAMTAMIYWRGPRMRMGLPAIMTMTSCRAARATIR